MLVIKNVERKSVKNIKQKLKVWFGFEVLWSNPGTSNPSLIWQLILTQQFTFSWAPPPRLKPGRSQTSWTLEQKTVSGFYSERLASVRSDVSAETAGCVCVVFLWNQTLGWVSRLLHVLDCCVLEVLVRGRVGGRRSSEENQELRNKSSRHDNRITLIPVISAPGGAAILLGTAFQSAVRGAAAGLPVEPGAGRRRHAGRLRTASRQVSQGQKETILSGGVLMQQKQTQIKSEVERETPTVPATIIRGAGFTGADVYGSLFSSCRWMKKGWINDLQAAWKVPLCLQSFTVSKFMSFTKPSDKCSTWRL